MYALVLAGAFLACESRNTAATESELDNNEGDTAVVSRRNPKVAAELQELKAWVNDKANRTDSSAKENLPKVKAEFNQRAARLEKNLDSLSAESKAEYARIKEQYKGWENEKEARERMPLEPAKLKQWEQQLIGPDKSLAMLTAADMRETYLLFMGIVRAKKNRWTQDDWDYVDNVYSRLNRRKQQVEAGMSSGDRLKVKTLQAEYLALEGSHDAQDILNHVKK